MESWSKGDRLVEKVARHTLQLDSMQGPNQLTVVAMKLTTETFYDRGQLYRNVCHWRQADIGEAARLRGTWRAVLWQ